MVCCHLEDAIKITRLWRNHLSVAVWVCVPPGQVLVLIEVLEEGGLADQLLLLTHLLAGAPWLGQPYLQSAEGGPHHLTVAEVLATQSDVTLMGITLLLFYGELGLEMIDASTGRTWFSMKALTLCSIPSQVNS